MIYTIFNSLYYLIPLYLINKIFVGKEKNKIKIFLSFLLINFVLASIMIINIPLNLAISLPQAFFSCGRILLYIIYFLFIAQIIYLNKDRLKSVYLKILTVISAIFQIGRTIYIYFAIKNPKILIWKGITDFSKYPKIEVEPIGFNVIFITFLLSIFLIPKVRLKIKEFYNNRPEKVRKHPFLFSILGLFLISILFYIF